MEEGLRWKIRVFRARARHGGREVGASGNRMNSGWLDSVPSLAAVAEEGLDSGDLSNAEAGRVKVSRLLSPGFCKIRQFCAQSLRIVVMAVPSRAPCQIDRPRSKPPDMKLACARNVGTGDPGAAKTPVAHSVSPSKAWLGYPSDRMLS